jgi:hypothetical protein
MPCPTALVYEYPQQRVLFHAARDANPFMHFFEALWMLAGRNDVAFMTKLARQFGAYTDDGKTFNGAYGYRWRTHFGKDQLQLIIERLRADPTDRRIVLSMWDGHHDLGLESRDLPCNTHIYFRLVDDKLQMTVCNRSNDLVWGAVGANVVHMSYLQEYVAMNLWKEVGQYTQFSSNLHAYEPHWPLLEKMDVESSETGLYGSRDPYAQGRVSNLSLLGEDPKTFDRDLEMFMNGMDEGQPPMGLQSLFFRRVATPMYLAWRTWHTRIPGRYELAVEQLAECAANDWALAALQWMQRRMEKAE